MSAISPSRRRRRHWWRFWYCGGASSSTETTETTVRPPSSPDENKYSYVISQKSTENLAAEVLDELLDNTRTIKRLLEAQASGYTFMKAPPLPPRPEAEDFLPGWLGPPSLLIEDIFLVWLSERVAYGEPW